jgi:hypothetical protein
VWCPRLCRPWCSRGYAITVQGHFAARPRSGHTQSHRSPGSSLQTPREPRGVEPLTSARKDNALPPEPTRRKAIAAAPGLTPAATGSACTSMVGFPMAGRSERTTASASVRRIGSPPPGQLAAARHP